MLRGAGMKTNKNDWEIVQKALEDAADIIRSAFLSISPLAERGTIEREKRYYLRHRWILNVDSYLFADCEGYVYWLDSKEADGNNAFTEKEIEDIKVELDTDLKDFEMVEVGDEN